MTNNPRVSVVIVNWNGAKHLRVCLPTLQAQSFQSLEIIVVDNRSSDDSAEVAKTHRVRWLPLEKNIGLAPGLNQGARVASGDFLLFVNNDMRFDAGFVAALVAPLESDAHIFSTDGMQFNWDGSRREHLAPRLTTKHLESSTELVPGLYFYQQDKSELSSVFMGSAACMMVRRTFFEQIGGFDDRLPLGYEDVDICWRAWTHNWKTVQVPDAVCWHHVGSSTSSSLAASRFNFRGILTGRLLLATKLLPGRYGFRTWLVSTLGLVKDIGGMKWKFFSDRLKVLLHMIKLLPQLLRDKKQLFTHAQRSPQEQLDFLLRLTDDDIRAGLGGQS